MAKTRSRAIREYLKAGRADLVANPFEKLGEQRKILEQKLGQAA
jgi:uncharacterized protein YqeY